MLSKKKKFTAYINLSARKLRPSLIVDNAAVNLFKMSLREAVTIKTNHSNIINSDLPIYYSLLTCNTTIAKTD